MRILVIDNKNYKTSLMTRLKSVSASITSLDNLSEHDLATISSADVIINTCNDNTLVDYFIRHDIKDKVIFSNLTDVQALSKTPNHCYLLSNYINNDQTMKLAQFIKDVKRAYVHPVLVDPASIEVLDYAKKVAVTAATVLLTGDTGTGKEMLAHYIHHHSKFRHGPFVAINCAALPEHMLEAIMFGYEKGAFTGAISQHHGKFEQAQHGTLLLDEISELPLGLQAKLLRVLQEKEIERVGGKHSIPVDVRIIAASNTDLQQVVQKQRFRKDLFYRLNVVQVNCLRLCDRPLDILPLANWFLVKYAEENGRQLPILTEKAKQKLLNYNWPGNIRELENVIQRCFIYTEDTLVRSDDLHFDHIAEVMPSTSSKMRNKLLENEAELIIKALQENNGSRQLTAKSLNMSPRTLRYKIAKLKLIGVEVP